MDFLLGSGEREVDIGFRRRKTVPTCLWGVFVPHTLPTSATLFTGFSGDGATVPSFPAPADQSGTGPSK